MIKKENEKIRAIELRKNGLSYSEILRYIPVAKSTLALWLQSVGLSKKQKQRLTEKKLSSARRGALKKKKDRIWRTKIIKEAAEMEIGKLTKREKWLVGIALYWAEGSKEKEWSPGSRAQLANSDPGMIRFFLHWLYKIAGISKERINLEIYIHENHKNRIPEVIQFWMQVTDFPRDHFSRIYYKRNKIQTTNRKNVGMDYYGILRISVTASSELNRKISGWINGIIKK